MPKRPRSRRRNPDLKTRVDAACCEFHGLTPAQLQRHKNGIVKVIERAKERTA